MTPEIDMVSLMRLFVFRQNFNTFFDIKKKPKR